jgi:hypothetical protein
VDNFQTGRSSRRKGQNKGRNKGHGRLKKIIFNSSASKKQKKTFVTQFKVGKLLWPQISKVFTLTENKAKISRNKEGGGFSCQ